MNFFYIISDLMEQYIFGVSGLQFVSFYSELQQKYKHPIVHLYISCYNPEILDELKSLNLDSNDLKKLISTSIEKINMIPTDIQSSSDVKIDLQPSQVIEETQKIVEQIPKVEESKVEEVKSIVVDDTPKIVEDSNVISDKQRFAFLENITFKIAEESQQVTHILNKLQSFKKNIHRANQNIDSLKKYKHPIHTPSVIQSERPRTMIDKTDRLSKGHGDTSVITIEECKIWVKNRLLNPKTGRKIEENGPTYKRLYTMSKFYKLM
jgi:hypothetical protein